MAGDRSFMMLELLPEGDDDKFGVGGVFKRFRFSV
jgi:hypothetical protein